jgi:hypothetical protein
MQNELNALDLPVEVQIIGINEAGYEAGNDTMTDGRDLPWLQDTDDAMVWDTWDVAFRDVIIVDERNVEIARFNVTSNSLSSDANYEALRDLFVDAATD